MNINSIYAKGSQEKSSVSREDSNNLSTFQKGEVIEGIISKVSDEVSINFNGREVSVSKSTIQEAKEGETRIFKIMDVSKTSIVLKEIGNSESNTDYISATWTNVETDASIFAERQIDNLPNTEKEDEKKAREKLEDIANRMTVKDLNDILNQGMSLEAYDLERLNRALERIKDQRVLNKASVEVQVAKIKQVSERAEQVIHVNVQNGVNLDRIVKKLEVANLPVTQANVMRIATALELGLSVGSVPQQAKGYLIKNELAPTIENLYKAQYSSSNRTENVISDSAWTEVKTQAMAIIEQAHLEVNGENLQNARWILNNNLPLTTDSILQLESLNKISEGIEEDVLLDKVIYSLSIGVPPESTSLEEGIFEEAVQVVKDISLISDLAIKKAVQDNELITLKNLKEAQSIISSSGIKGSKDLKKIELTKEIADIDIKEITAKRQLEEIRLKMTVESSSKMMEKGILVNTESLEKVVEGLRELENSYYSSLLQGAGALSGQFEVSLLRETTDKISGLKEMPSYILGANLAQRKLETVNELYSDGSSLKVKLDKVNSTYDVLMTSPRKDLGDTIEKAFRNVDNLLSDLNLEVTKANQRAVRILGYNNMEISEENITNVKIYDNQVNQLMSNLNPSVAVHLIKEGINPLNTPIEELNNQILKIKNDLGLSEEEKYSKYLWKLEKENGLTSEERKAYIGIYRLFNNIEKTKGAAIGYVLNADQDVTLNKLLTAVRTMKSKGIDKEIDDSFGALESLSFSKDTITDQLSAVFQTNSKYSSDDTISIGVDESRDQNIDSKSEKVNEMIGYMSSLLNNIMDEITPSKVGNMANSEDLLNLSLEKFEEMLVGTEDNESLNDLYNEVTVAKIRELATKSEDVIPFLNSFNIPDSIPNLMSAKEFLNTGSNIYKKIQNRLQDESYENIGEIEGILDGFLEGLENKESMFAQYEKLEESLSNILNKQYEDNQITAKDIAELKSLSSSINFAKELSKRECYEIPLISNGEVTNVNLTIVSGVQENGKIKLNIETKLLGKIEASIVVKSKEMIGFIVSDESKGLEIVKANKEMLKDRIEVLGLELKKLDYGIENQVKDRYKNQGILHKSQVSENEDVTSQTSTKSLYQVAKAVILHIKELDLKTKS